MSKEEVDISSINSMNRMLRYSIYTEAEDYCTGKFPAALVSFDSELSFMLFFKGLL